MPAVSADWLSSAFIVDVDFYVCVFAFAVPGVLAMFNMVGHVYSLVRVDGFVHLKQSTERQAKEWGELGESKRCSVYG